PYQAVVEVAVAEVLIHVPLVGLGEVVPATGAFRRRIGGDDGGALIEVECDVALEVNRVAEIVSGGEEDGAAAGGRRCFDGLLYGRGIEGLSVAGGTERPYVQRTGSGSGSGMGRDR